MEADRVPVEPAHGPEQVRRIESDDRAPMLLERVLPQCDAARAEHVVIEGTLPSVYDAVLRTDFVKTWRESAAVRVLFAARSLGERAVSTLRQRPLPETPSSPSSLRLADLPENGEWVLLGTDPPDEVAFGAIGRFWAGETVWEHLAGPEFARFRRPGLAKIACNFSLRPYGARRVLLSYECRTLATDDAARAGFMRYWRALSPFIGVVMREQLRAIAQESAAGASA